MLVLRILEERIGAGKVDSVVLDRLLARCRAGGLRRGARRLGCEGAASSSGVAAASGSRTSSPGGGSSMVPLSDVLRSSNCERALGKGEGRGGCTDSCRQEGGLE